MPRFVILEHDYPSIHWDFMLEEGDHLRTWKLLESPEILHAENNEKPNISIKAETSFDHRLIYLDYEGPISGNRGSVKRIEQGAFELLEQTDEKVVIKLQGQKIKGLVQFTKLKPTELNKPSDPDHTDPDNWQLELLPLSLINQMDTLNS